MGKLNLKLTLIAMTTLYMYQIGASQSNAPLITKNVTDGQSVSVRCRDTPSGSLSWFKITPDGSEQISDDGRRQTDEEGTLHFAYVEVTDTGRYKCGRSKINEIQLGSPFQLNVKEGVNNSNIPVKLLRSSGETNANLGEDVTLECIFSGRPVPVVSWFRDNRKLTSADNVTISGGLILIKQVSAKDTGIYSCTGKNSGGEEYATMNLNVIDPNKVPPSTRGYRDTKQTTRAVVKTDMETAKPNPGKGMEVALAGSGTVSGTSVVAAVTAILWIL